MAFTVSDLQDLLEILRTKPEWKEALRRELLGEELFALPRLLYDLTRAVEEMNKRLYRVEQDVAGLKADVAELKGDSLERKYRERPFVCFRRIARKLKLLTDSELESLLSAAMADGVLTEADAEEIARLDALIRGRRISDDREVYLAVEVSAKFDARDVERAARRAQLLEKIPGMTAVPVIAGEALTDGGAQAARQAAVWTVTDGTPWRLPPR